jgi:hypothetical protein
VSGRWVKGEWRVEFGEWRLSEVWVAGQRRASVEWKGEVGHVSRAVVRLAVVGQAGAQAAEAEAPPAARCPCSCLLVFVSGGS